MDRGLLKRRTIRLAKLLVVSVAIALIAYVTLDAIYFHALFSSENAVVDVGLIQSLIVIASTSLLLFIQQKEKQKLTHKSSTLQNDA